MIHGPELHEILQEQIDLSENSASLDDDGFFTSYIANMDICPDCLIMLAGFYCEQNGVTDIADMAIFMRGFSTGVIVGRRYPVVKGLADE